MIRWGSVRIKEFRTILIFETSDEFTNIKVNGKRIKGDLFEIPIELLPEDSRKNHSSITEEYFYVYVPLKYTIYITWDSIQIIAPSYQVKFITVVCQFPENGPRRSGGI